MKSANLNLRPAGSMPAPAKAPENVPPSERILSGWLNADGRAEEVPGLNGLVLTLQKLFGMLLGGIAMGAQFGSVFVCLSVLLVGYSFFFNLLPA